MLFLFFHFDIWMFPKIVVPPNHPILIGYSIINYPFWGTPIFGSSHIFFKDVDIKQPPLFSVNSGKTHTVAAKNCHFFFWFGSGALSWYNSASFSIHQESGTKFESDKNPVKHGKLHVDVSENRGTPKWMIYNGKPY